MVSASRKIAAFALLAASAGFVVAHQPPAAPPKPSESAAVTKPAAAPKAVRSTEHRKIHRPAPKIAKRKWEPVPGVRPVKPIMKEEKRKRIAKPRTKSLPSCAEIRHRRDAMTFAEQLQAYSRATPEEVAHGRRCLGL